MAIQAPVNYNSRNEDLGFPLIGSGPDFPLMKNCCNVGFDELCLGLQQKSQLLRQRNMNQMQIFSDEKIQYQSLAAQMEKQEQEIDRFMRLESERLRFLVHEQRKQQRYTILKSMESRASTLIRQKDEEISRAAGRRQELEALLQKMEVENQRWQNLAKEKESMVLNLKNMVEQARERADAAAVEDEGSCCGGENGNLEGCLDGGKIEGKCEKMGMVCRSCGSGNSCVVFLPCRHLCSCRDCEAYLDSCPVCSSPKKASIEALIF